jgi:D-glycero-D-manno-heptose 1,7-bisphosphate phosphatase
MRPAVFLDRDDTLIEARSLPVPPPPAAAGDVFDPALVRLLPGVAEACGRLRGAGFVLIVVSNQGSVARGAASLTDVECTNGRVRELIPTLSAFYFCPFHPQGRVPELAREHPWRKPGPGMMQAAGAELGLDLARSWLVGDAQRDIEAGTAAGLSPGRCLLVGPGAALADLAAAARVILEGPEDSSHGHNSQLTSKPGTPGGAP